MYALKNLINFEKNRCIQIGLNNLTINSIQNAFQLAKLRRLTRLVLPLPTTWAKATTLTLGTVSAENTRHRGKYHYSADLIFDWFGFDQTSKAVANSV